MSYTKIVQCGLLTEIYRYKNNYVHSKKRDYSKNQRKSSTSRGFDNALQIRRSKSIKRSRVEFLRLVAANLSSTPDFTFLTLTIENPCSLEVGYIYLTQFWQRLKKHGIQCRYIGVPEWQKRGALHFHFMVWGFDVKDIKQERHTRNIQRCWQRGFCDVRTPTYVSGGLAGYMAKYLTKTLLDNRLGNRRAYTCSRNVYRPTTVGSNSLDDYMDMIFDPVENSIIKSKIYDTLWLGQCNYNQYKKICKS